MEHFRSIVFSFPITVISLAIKIQNGSLQIKLLSLLSWFFFFLILPILNFCLETYNEKDKKKKKAMCLFGNSGFLKIRDSAQ